MRRYVAIALGTDEQYDDSRPFYSAAIALGLIVAGVVFFLLVVLSASGRVHLRLQ
jgi:hypothetical protein